MRSFLVRSVRKKGIEVYKARLKCEVITPVFMAGADGRTPELRPSEFKGMMRFWWRAVKAEDDIAKLKKEENGIFGGTGEGEGKSKATVKVFCDKFFWEKALRVKEAGIKYLLYSTILPNKERGYIKEGSTFYIEISTFEEKYLNHALASLWFAIYFGGFGTRNRRGGGNIIVTEVDEHVSIDFIPKGKDSDEVAEWLVKNFEIAKKIINGSDKTYFASEYSNLSISRLIISNIGFTSWKDAVNDIGTIFKNFRVRTEGQVFESAVFGLPVRHRSGGTVIGVKIEKKSKEKFQRRTSPIIIKLIKVEGKYYWSVIRLAGQFLPEGAVLKFNDKTQKPEYALIEEFWAQLKERGEEKILSIPDSMKEIVDKIKENIDPEKIYLYGSRARGDFNKKSDIDIAVESDKSVEAMDMIGPFDIVNLKKVNKEFREKIYREGVLLYERKG